MILQTSSDSPDFINGVYGDMAYTYEWEIQQAIHWIEGEGGYPNSFVNEAEAAAWSNIGKVQVLNLWVQESCNPTTGLYDGYAQDLLIMVPAIIPAPSAVLLGLIGLSNVNYKFHPTTTIFTVSS